MIKSPQNNLSAYLINAVNIKIYNDLEFKEIEYTDLEFFNLLYLELHFFSENIENYIAIKEHFKFPDESYILHDGNEKPKYIPIPDSFSITDSFLIDSLNLIINEIYPINSRNEIISKSCEHLYLLNEYFNSKNYHKLCFESLLDRIDGLDLNENEKIKELHEYRIDYLQNPHGYFEEDNDVPFDKKCELEIERITINQTHKQPKLLVDNTLNWQGTELQFTELTKALFETKLISPHLLQNEFFKRMKLFFNVKEFNENDKIKDIINRSNTPTPLLNILETSLNNYRDKKLEKRKNK